MRRMHRGPLGGLTKIIASSAILLAISCSPGGDVDTSSDKFLIYNLNTDTGDYELERVSIETLNDVRAVDGDVVEMRGGGKLTTGIQDPQTREEWEQVLLIENTITPQVEYTVDRDGTVVPWDFDSAMMLTVYHHLERAREYFDELPLSDSVRADLNNKKIGDLVGRIPCYYYPSISILGVPIPIFVDNAAYAFTLNGFIVPPRQSLVDAVPIYANRGVMTHEYSHAVFNRLVYNGEKVPDPIFEKWDEIAGTKSFQAANELGGLDEGIADIFGALDTKDANYIAASISEELIDRDLAVPRYYDQCLLMAVESGAYPEPEDCGGNYAGTTCKDAGTCPEEPVDSQGVRFDYSAGGQYDSHHLGAVAAAVIWEFRERNKSNLTDDDIAEFVVIALRAIQEPTTDFRITHFFDAFHAALPAQYQSGACELFKERLIVIRDELQCQI
ncbi:MAG: hypothetical protein VX475_16315 [Myxococcota bacterium]|nr:hypothetical protein [Myxococcota bacterium]